MAARYDARAFVKPGFERASGEFSDETRNDIDSIRAAHPELESWGDLAVVGAWGDYSQDELYVNWCDWLVGERNEEFLAYVVRRTTFKNT